MIKSTLLFSLCLAISPLAMAFGQQQLTETQKEALIPHYPLMKACNVYITTRSHGVHRFANPHSEAAVIEGYCDRVCGFGGAQPSANEMESINPAWLRDCASKLRDAQDQ